uniref:Putative secreted peptide n=1 Tax=Rhipicephalus pulchellus TaxID=72859 RepID=L7M9Z8_RHIPC
MSLTYLLLWGCIISALLRPSEECSGCCGSCTKPNSPACNKPAKGNKKLYFPEGGECKETSPEGCKGKFYMKKEDCKSCCRTTLNNQQGRNSG